MKLILDTFFTQGDSMYHERLAALSEYLLMNVDFSSTTKHAGSMIRLLTTCEWRATKTWNKADNTNKRTKHFQNKLIENVPSALKTFIQQERAKHIRYFAINAATEEPKAKVVKYDPSKWLGKVRKMFTLSTGTLHEKHILVRHLSI